MNSLAPTALHPVTISSIFPARLLPRLRPRTSFRLPSGLGLSKAQKLNPCRPPRIRQCLFHPVKMHLQILVPRPARIRLRNLVIQLTQRLVRRGCNIAAERLVHKFDFQSCL